MSYESGAGLDTGAGHRPAMSDRRAAIAALGATKIQSMARSPFAFLFAGYAVSLLGDYAYRVTLSWHLAATEGPAGVAALGIAMTLPVALLAIFAGAVADRTDRLKLLIVADLVRA